MAPNDKAPETRRTVSIEPVKKEKSGGWKVLLVLAIVILLLVVLLAVGALLVNKVLNKINKIEDVEIVAPEDAKDEVDDFEEDYTYEPAEAEPIEDVEWEDSILIDTEGLINIMLVGQDTRTVGGRERSDVMILVSINPKTNQATMISFMRDLYIQMPEGYMDNRMNAAYAYGGFPYLYEVMEKNFGIVCDGGFEVNFTGFEKVIDAVGGVDVELSAQEASKVSGAVQGANHLNGKQALQYARIRHIDSDFNRTARQRAVLRGVFSNLKKADVATLYSLLDTVLPYMSTDMSNSEIVSLAAKLVPIVSKISLDSYRIPADGTYYDATIRGMSVLVPNLEKNRTYLKGVLPLNDDD